MRTITIFSVITAAGAITSTSNAILLDITGTATVGTVINGDALPGDLGAVNTGDTFAFAARWNTATQNAVPIDVVTTGYQNTVVGTYEADNELSEPIFTGGFTDATLDVTDATPDIPRGIIAENDEIDFTFVDDLDGGVVDFGFTLSGSDEIFDSQSIPVGITDEAFDETLFTFVSGAGSGTGTVDEFAITLVPAPGAATIAGIGLLGATRRRR